MLTDLIEKIAAQTGLPAATVQPVLGAVLAHMGDVLPPPIAHMLAIALGIHEDDSAPQSGDANAGGADGGLGGLLGSLTGGGNASAAQAGGGDQGLGGLLGSLMGGGKAGGFAGAGALASVAEQLLGGLLSGRR